MDGCICRPEYFTVPLKEFFDSNDENPGSSVTVLLMRVPLEVIEKSSVVLKGFYDELKKSFF